MELAAIIATYGRPGYLRRCVDRLREQSKPYAALVIIARDTDEPTRAVARELERHDPRVIVGTVAQRGHLPPLEEARRLLPAGIEAVLIVDDDCLVPPDSIERLSALVESPGVGAAAGRIIQFDEGCRRAPAATRRVGQIGYSGRVHGRHDAECVPSALREVWFGPGGFVCYRREAFDRIAIRATLNHGVAVHYEVDWGLQVRAMGYRFLYDPTLAAEHHNAPRIDGAPRRVGLLDREDTYWLNHNTTLLMWHHLRGSRRAAFVLDAALVGHGENWALVCAVKHTLRHRDLQAWPRLLASYRGKLAAARRLVARA
ncbi:MAG TPA: glycosyltransferase [Kofleriaceae bacterium]|nr:glycosyltransferase [Kofleriaceae bacterium]